ncbi:hypothetical protein PDJAM_G00114400 [Pangasius djambal]|uniref:Uncharacterized protein n=1 Tax=Pangasius djambal TaxID=1691987 RepID=A0ACC5Y2X4_9TELE|nr:hypothetical protein [Pangasius djambal]
MASSCKETSLPVESFCISQSFTGGDKRVRGDEKIQIQIQDQSSAEKPKINRLKRVKKTKKSDLMLSECKVLRPEVTDHHHHHHHHEKRSHTSTMKNTIPPSTPGAQCSPPKRDLHPLLLHMNMSLGQNKREIRSEGTASSRLSRRGSRAGRSGELREREENESENSTAFTSYSTSASHGARFQSSTEFFKNAHGQEEFLQQLRAQNPRFPVQRLFQTLLKRRGEGKSAPVVPVAGKRKQEVESHGDGRLRKRQRSSQDDGETVNRSEGRVSSRHGERSRNRLRRKQPRVQDAAVDESRQDEGHDDDAGHDDDTGHCDDVPWTEIYRPRSCDEVIGNSAAVRKLYRSVCSTQVDIIFEEDVGFLAAVKSLMSTTKRPIVLTANDPSFGESFGGRFGEIRFQTPATESVVSYLQCVCVVQSVKPDPEHIRFVVRENNGDVRRSVLELEVWARSGAGNTHHHLRNRALACRSYAELESSRCVEALEESWKKGRSLLHSNLDLLLAPPTIETSDQSAFDQNTTFTFQNDANKNPSPSGQPSSPENFQCGKRSREMKRSESELLLDRFKPMDQSAAEAGDLSEVSSLARFCDTVSFLDSEQKSDEIVHKVLRSKAFRYHGNRTAVLTDYLPCLRFICGARDAEQQPDLSEQKSDEIVHKVLRSKAFRYHGNRTAVLTDYLPCLRFICGARDAEQQPDLRFSHYLRDIGLRLRKSDVLASQLH